MKVFWRAFNYWTTRGAWRHMFQLAKNCTKANVEGDFYDEWRW